VGFLVAALMNIRGLHKEGNFFISKITSSALCSLTATCPSNNVTIFSSQLLLQSSLLI